MYVWLAMLMIVPSIVFWGFVLKILWGWFLSPRFTATVPSVTLCMGITTIFTMLVEARVAKKASDKEETLNLGFDIGKLPIDERSKRQLKALQKLADTNAAYAFRESLMGMFTAPLTALIAGWVLKHFL